MPNNGLTLARPLKAACYGNLNDSIEIAVPRSAKEIGHMRQSRYQLVAFVYVASLAGCGPEPTVPRASAALPASSQSPAAPNPAAVAPKVTQVGRPAQEIAFIRECLAVGLRPSLILELESRAMSEAQGATRQARPSKAQLDDLRSTFQSSATKLIKLSTSSDAGKLSEFAQLLGQARSKQASNCARLTDEWLNLEGMAQMLVAFRNISSQARTEQEADRKAGEHFKQNWRNLTNLPIQQQVALAEILETEQQLQQVVVKLSKDPELQSVQRSAMESVLEEFEARARNAANTLTPARFYETLIGHQFRTKAGRLEAGEMVKLEILEQKIVGHCIVSLIRLDLRGSRSGQTASLNLSVVHKTYADGRLARLQVVER